MKANPNFIEDVKAKMEKVNFNDGINEAEAAIIAQNHLIDKFKDRDSLEIKIYRPKVENNELYSERHVVFGLKFSKIVGSGLKWYSVGIDKLTGAVKSDGFGPS